MSAIKNILVPTDFSHASREALRYACSLADDVKASLHILHATDYPYFVRGYMDFYPLPQEVFDDIERSATKNLNDLLSAEDMEKYHVTLVHRSGSAVEEDTRLSARAGRHRSHRDGHAWPRRSDAVHDGWGGGSNRADRALPGRDHPGSRRTGTKRPRRLMHEPGADRARSVLDASSAPHVGGGIDAQPHIRDDSALCQHHHRVEIELLNL